MCLCVLQLFVWLVNGPHIKRLSSLSSNSLNPKSFYNLQELSAFTLPPYSILWGWKSTFSLCAWLRVYVNKFGCKGVACVLLVGLVRGFDCTWRLVSGLCWILILLLFNSGSLVFGHHTQWELGRFLWVYFFIFLIIWEK